MEAEGTRDVDRGGNPADSWAGSLLFTRFRSFESTSRDWWLAMVGCGSGLEGLRDEPLLARHTGSRETIRFTNGSFGFFRTAPDVGASRGGRAPRGEGLRGLPGGVCRWQASKATGAVRDPRSDRAIPDEDVRDDRSWSRSRIVVYSAATTFTTSPRVRWLMKARI